MSTNIYTSYKLIHASNKTTYAVDPDFQCIIRKLYEKLSGSLAMIDSLRLKCESLGTTVSIFMIKYDFGIVLYNEYVFLRIRYIFPEFVAADTMLQIQAQPTQPTLPVTVTKPQYKQPSQQNQSSKSILKPTPPIKTKLYKNFTNEEINIFVSDKRSYLKIKEDIAEGNVEFDKIHPEFVAKYQIMKVLESRGVINFDSTDSIETEYEIFSQLYNEIKDDEDEDDEPSNNAQKTPQKKVFVPHNYNYLSIEAKESCAKSYGMSLKQFEETYVCGVSDDMIHGFKEYTR